MKVSINWLKELVDLKTSVDEVVNLLPLKTVGIKEITPDFFELDMKGYNRADLLSLRGVANEVAAITDSKVIFQEESGFVWDDLKLSEANVKVVNPELAPLYCIAKIEGLKVSKSSDKWVGKLSDCGMRSINNIADITNLIMLEFGQPLHAFDISQIKDETLVVRCANPGEEIITLDEKVRKLSTSDLLITDPEKAVGIAGVMGGKNSEIADSTVTIFLEAAIFDPINLRKTATRLNLSSEASKRFQHGLTKKRCLQALDTAIRMYQDLGGKLTAISIIGDLEDKQKTIDLRKSQMDSLIGIEIPEKDVESYLQKLNFKVLRTQEETLRRWKVTPPYYRLDIEIEADVIEEVARMYGYERIKPKELSGKLPEKIDQKLFEFIYKLKVALAISGLTEVQTYSFYSTQVINNMGYDKNTLVRIGNPISSETEYLRTNLWPNLVEAVAKNKKQGFEDIAIFEIGKTYQLTKSKEIQEDYKLSIALLNGSDNPSQELYQILNTLEDLKEKAVLGDPIGKSDGRFHPIRYSYLLGGNKPVGKIGEVHLRITDKFGIEQRVAIIELQLPR